MARRIRESDALPSFRRVALAVGAALALHAHVGCTTSETGFIDLAVASVAPVPSAGPPVAPGCRVDSDCPRATPHCVPTPGTTTSPTMPAPMMPAPTMPAPPP